MTQPTDTPPAAAAVPAPAPAPDDDPAGTAQDRMLAGPPRQRAARKRRAVAVTPAMLEGAPEFAPVPRQHARYDGWTPERQRAFVKLLAEYGCVRRAAGALGMSEVGAYQMRRAPGAEGFAKAWAEALETGINKLRDAAMERALYGVAEPVFHKGEQVGERRRYNDRLATWILRHEDPERYGAPNGHRVPPHVRRALHAEWEADQAEEYAAASDRFHAKLEDMRRRMEESGDLGPRSTIDLSRCSMAERFIIWAYGHDGEEGGGAGNALRED